MELMSAGPYNMDAVRFLFEMLNMFMGLYYNDTKRKKHTTYVAILL